ncbi:Serine protease [Halomonadaceae bacterium LMG 33818]|uniref:prolyl oligopeptidase family serine peptidase n=1 Tax=Cernens ardua TaxID=3402176 RepID=UPI003EDC0F83
MNKSIVSENNASDQWQWLEEVESAEALAWVKEKNQRTLDDLAQDKPFHTLTEQLLANKQRDDRIPGVKLLNGWCYNFWQDAEHPRGIWRRVKWESYITDYPAWETVFDVDQLNRDENATWVWHGVQILRAKKGEASRRALISLSRGGADADITREFDIEEKQWVEDGFFRPEAKGSLSWIDIDHVFVATDFGEDSMTTSGYPRQVKKWARGTPMESAELVCELGVNDMTVGAYHDDTPGYERDMVEKISSFYSSQLLELMDDGTLLPLELPDSAEKYVVRDWLNVTLKEDWATGQVTYPAGSALIIRYDEFKAGSREFTRLFTPAEGTAFEEVTFTKDYIILETRHHVRQRFTCFSLQDNQHKAAGEPWVSGPIPGLPEGEGYISAVDDEDSNDYWLYVTDFITPTRLFRGSLDSHALTCIKSTPPSFDASGMKVEQRFATSKDGTRIPYFIILPKACSPKSDDVSRETLPTLLYGYGGFEVSLTPTYLGSTGIAWLSKGGAMVLANIRGGSEYGPDWHRAALKEKRHKAYEDFAAVAKDLVEHDVTTVRQLGIKGGSNGGLLVGNMVTTYPELFSAAVCQVPLLDMKRYPHLLAGASWMAEYGDPDTDDWDFLQHYSPYHSLDSDIDYPEVLFTTTTRDDRVHPGHARKMMAKMEQMGKPVLYFENTEGGHGSGADARQQAQVEALEWRFLQTRLMRN